jgi:hypothetical protein
MCNSGEPRHRHRWRQLARQRSRPRGPDRLSGSKTSSPGDAQGQTRMKPPLNRLRHDEEVARSQPIACTNLDC